MELNSNISKYITKRLSMLFSQQKGDYFCIRVEDFLSNIKIPLPPIKENSLSLVYITEGILNIKLGYSDYIVRQDELLLIQAFKPFYIEEESPSAKGFIFHIKADGMIGSMGSHSLILNMNILEIWSKSKYVIKQPFSKFIINIFERIHLEYCASVDNTILVNAYAITLLLEINGLSDNLSETSSSAIDLNHRFKKEVYNSLNIKLSISDYAKRLSVSANHLNKSIKLVTGDSTSSLLIKIKLTEAKYLLFMGELSVTDIAYKLGFEDSSYFSRFFRKHEGSSPVKYRNSSRLIAKSEV